MSWWHRLRRLLLVLLIRLLPFIVSILGLHHFLAYAVTSTAERDTCDQLILCRKSQVRPNATLYASLPHATIRRYLPNMQRTSRTRPATLSPL